MGKSQEKIYKKRNKLKKANKSGTSFFEKVNGRKAALFIGKLSTPETICQRTSHRFTLKITMAKTKTMMMMIIIVVEVKRVLEI